MISKLNTAPVDFLGVVCSHCGAKPGRHCRGTERHAPHYTRRLDAYKARNRELLAAALEVEAIADGLGFSGGPGEGIPYHRAGAAEIVAAVTAERQAAAAQAEALAGARTEYRVAGTRGTQPASAAADALNIAHGTDGTPYHATIVRLGSDVQAEERLVLPWRGIPDTRRQEVLQHGDPGPWPQPHGARLMTATGFHLYRSGDGWRFAADRFGWAWSELSAVHFPVTITYPATPDHESETR